MLSERVSRSISKNVIYASLLVVLLSCMVGVTSADEWVGGIPLETVQTCTVTGDLWFDVDPAPDWGELDVTKTFTLPAAAVEEEGRITWARLYISAYCGRMQDDKAFTITNRFDGDGDGKYEYVWEETGHSGFNYVEDPWTREPLGNDNRDLGGGPNDPYKLINDHENRVTSDYFMWYDVTDLITSQTVNVNVNTAGSFDGRIKVISLVVAYDDPSSSTKTTYWVNQGHDVCSYYVEVNFGYPAVGMTTFDTSDLSEFDSAHLTINYMASESGKYGFPTEDNNLVYTGGNPPVEGAFTDALDGTPDVESAYSGVISWDVTRKVTGKSEVTLAYARDSTVTGTAAYYKIPLAFLVVKETLAPPAVNFSANATSGDAPLVIRFTDESTGDPNSWEWDFGDGGSSGEQNPEYTYETPGTYTVGLTVSNNAGTNVSEKTDYITVTDPAGPLSADFETNVIAGEAPFTVRFTDKSTGGPVSWLWDFGDGGNSTEQNPEHTYRIPGIYTVTLNASRADDFNTTVKIDCINVTSPPPAVNFTADVTSGTAPLTVNFTDLSTNNPTSWSWTFGDGNTSDEQHPAHTYTHREAWRNRYNVSLTATNGSGSDSLNKTHYIIVDPPEKTEDISGKINLTGTVNETIIITYEDCIDLTVPEGTVAMVNNQPIINLSVSLAPAEAIPVPPAKAMIAAGDKVFVLGPEGAGFDPKVQVSISFTEDEWGRFFGTGYDTTIQRFSNDTWTSLERQTKNETTRTISGWTDTFSIFAPITVSTGGSTGGGGDSGSNYRNINLAIEGMVNPRPANAVSTNQPNVVMIPNIKNLGADAAGEFTVALYASDVDEGKKPVATTTVEGLAGGNQTTISIVDPTLRKVEGSDVIYRAVIDPDEKIQDTDRSNNEKSSFPKPVKHNGYNGKRWQGRGDITTQRIHDIHGGLIHSLGDSRYRSGGFAQGWIEFSITWTADDLPIPSNATVKEAWLYAPYAWDNSDEVKHAALTFNGVPVKLQAWYHDVSNIGAYHDHAYGLLTYDVTPEFQKNRQNVAKFSRKNEDAKLSMGGFTLAVVYEDPSAVRSLIFLNEGFDILGVDEINYGTTSERTIAYVPFAGPAIDLDQVSRAELITFVPWGDNYEGNLYVNGNRVASNVWDFGSAGGPQVAVDTRDVWNHLKPTGNEVAIQSTPVGLTPLMAVSQQFLVVEMGGKEVRQLPPADMALKADFRAEPLTGPAPLSVRFRDLSEGDPHIREWDFGDGGTVENTTQNPHHVYRTPGNYTVTLTVRNATAEHTEKKEGYILVENATVRPAGSDAWVPLEDQAIDEATRTISGWTRRFSVFAPITVPKASANLTPDNQDYSGTGTGESSTTVTPESNNAIDPLEATEEVGDRIDPSTGVVSETIVITCGDAARFTIPEGTVAMVNGRPITRLSVARASDDDIPDLPAGTQIAVKDKVFLFEPEGAVFSPPIQVSITFTEDEWALLFGENDTTIQRFERVQREDGTAVKNESGLLSGGEEPGTADEAFPLEILLISALLCALGAGGLWMGLRVMPANRIYAGVGAALLLIAVGLIAVHAAGFISGGGSGPADLDPDGFSVRLVIERIEDLNTANDLPDYPEEFAARNGLLVMYSGRGGVPISSLEVELASGGERITIGPSSTPPDDPGLNAGITTYFEEIGDGDGVISSGEWLMVYADGCLIRTTAGMKQGCLVWNPGTSPDPLTVTTGDLLQYRLFLLPAREEIASGEVRLSLGSLDPPEIVTDGRVAPSSTFTVPEDLLMVGTPFIYTDLTGGNEISICPRSAVTRSSFWYKIDGETVSVTAPEGKTHMIINICLVHRGNFDGVNYTIETPVPSAFMLHGGDADFAPLYIPVNASTSFGEVYTQKTLDRKELIDGSILFEIPDTMRLSDVYLSIDSESIPGHPVWVLGQGARDSG